MKIARITSIAGVLVACSDGGTGDDTTTPGGGEGGSFHAVIDGEPWDADSDKIGAVVGDFGGGPVFSLNATNGALQEFFTIQLDAFEGDFSTTDFTGIVLRYSGNVDVYEAASGSLTMHQTGDGLSETYTGEFYGTFPNVFETASVEITDGSFEVHRLL